MRMSLHLNLTREQEDRLLAMYHQVVVVERTPWGLVPRGYTRHRWWNLPLRWLRVHAALARFVDTHLRDDLHRAGVLWHDD